MDSDFFDFHTGFEQVLSCYPAVKWMNEVGGHVVTGRRHELEKNPRRRQLLPYVVVRQRGADGILRYLPFRRTKKGGEPKLHDMVSIAYAGHIDAKDIVYDEKSVLLLPETIQRAAFRETMGEELRARSGVDTARFQSLEIKFADEFLIAHFGVHLVHFGILMTVDLPQDLVLESAEDQLVSLGAMTARELLGAGLPIEYWSQVFLEHHIDD